MLLCTTMAAAQAVTPQSDVLGSHDMGAGTSPMRGSNANACSYCHFTHGGLSTTPLWNQRLSTGAYEFYSSTTSQNVSVQPTVGKTSTLCLSCHDGTVAIGQTVAIGNLKMTGTMSVLGTKLQGSHPFSLQLPMKDAAHLVPSLAASGLTQDPTGAVKLIDKNIECSTCHNVHNQYIDKRSHKFLVRDNVGPDNAGGQICLSCHTTAARTVGGRDNTLAVWAGSTHATSTATLAPNLSLVGYETITQSGCSTCHATHNATGTGLLRSNATHRNNVDDTSQSCFNCHDGGSALTKPLLNVLLETQKVGHPFADVNNLHTLDEPVVLDHNRHTTCADCHNGHGSRPTTTFTGTADLRPSQANVSGVRSDGTVVNTAINQYENCLRCHGTSTDKKSLPIYGVMPARAMNPGNTLNVLAEFSDTASSTHPVMRNAKNILQPSLLGFMWSISGTVQSRPMGDRILCTDCHNSDDNREFGGLGPNGPHGSLNTHILERKYVISEVAPAAGAGSVIINLTPTPALDPASAGPYSMCAKCHHLTNIMSNVSFTEHSRHINDGFSCSVCHSAHGVPAGTAGVNGKRLVTFDMNVVAPNNGVVSYNGGISCTLMCHGHAHNQP